MGWGLNKENEFQDKGLVLSNSGNGWSLNDKLSGSFLKKGS